MKLVIDENIVFAEEAFSEFGKIILLPGREMKNSDLRDADILIVRSVTNVNKDLLNNSHIRFVGTATIGTDHFDKNYMKENGIFFCSAEGCNSMSVAEYVFAGIFSLTKKYKINLSGKSVGIIGVGNVGSKVKKIAEAVGLSVFQNDPPRQKKENRKDFVSLNEALNCDIVTFHVPLKMSGEDCTYKLLNENNLARIKPGSILINTSRGSVVDNASLKKRLTAQKDIFTILDVWENEPDFDLELLNLVDFGTPHIAGYSFEGKVNGTKIIYDKLCEYLSRPVSWKPKTDEPTENQILWNENKSVQDNLEEIFPLVYSIQADDNRLRNYSMQNSMSHSQYFDYLRKSYPRRREFSAYKVSGNKFSADVIKVLQSLNIELNKNSK
jgi:erythronate-4-phosphate dehydrogenase